MNRETLLRNEAHPWRDRAVEAGLALAVAGVLFGLAAGPAFGQEPTVVAPYSNSDVLGRVVIPYAPANLDSKAYVSEIKGEIRRASLQVCPWRAFSGVDGVAGRNSCVGTAREDGYAQLNRAIDRGMTFADRGGAGIVLVAHR